MLELGAEQCFDFFQPCLELRFVVQGALGQRDMDDVGLQQLYRGMTGRLEATWKCLGFGYPVLQFAVVQRVL